MIEQMKVEYHVAALVHELSFSVLDGHFLLYPAFSDVNLPKFMIGSQVLKSVCIVYIRWCTNFKHTCIEKSLH
jgi:hypothetical protein